MPTNNKPNRLIAEKSTYFTSHAHNPVDWFHGEKKPSKKQNAKTNPFVSIGYSTCHSWPRIIHSCGTPLTEAILNDNTMCSNNTVYLLCHSLSKTCNP
ncbi:MULTISPECIES: DUF255 domain-containing protein [unclassified Bacillus (in: firmicutes)]|uniref:DUF255 domain-containing protein n=1 Tax=Bacillus TaxID=1386 RepID=UPI00339D61B4